MGWLLDDCCALRGGAAAAIRDPRGPERWGRHEAGEYYADAIRRKKVLDFEVAKVQAMEAGAGARRSGEGRVPSNAVAKIK
jgi:hypothetical protein